VHRKAKQTKKTTVPSQGDLARLLRLSITRVQQMLKLGMPGVPGAYCLEDCQDWIAANVNGRQQKQLPLPGTDSDPLLSAGDSPALERYRDERAKLARLDRLERERQLLRRDAVHELLARMAGILRGTGEVFQRQFGPDALSILNEAVDEFDSAIEEFCAGSSDDLYGPTEGRGEVVQPTGESAETPDDS
jgi:hypothetical protein